MVNWFSNLFSGAKNFFGGLGSKLKDTVNNVVGGVRNIAGKIGSGLNTVTGAVRKGYDVIGNIPVVGDILKNTSVGQLVNKGLGIAEGVGNVANAISSGNDIPNAVKGLITASGGSPEGVKKTASELLNSIIG
jgi:hypothetical protein